MKIKTDFGDLYNKAGFKVTTAGHQIGYKLLESSENDYLII